MAKLPARQRDVLRLMMNLSEPDLVALREAATDVAGRGAEPTADAVARTPQWLANLSTDPAVLYRMLADAGGGGRCQVTITCSAKLSTCARPATPC
jgi:hypothetical protein